MSSLREFLAALPDSRERTVMIKSIGKAVTIRRLSIRERDEVLRDYRVAEKDPEAGARLSTRLVALGLADPKTSEEDLADVPAVVVQEIATALMDFNGWTPRGQAALEDQFRPSA